MMGKLPDNIFIYLIGFFTFIIYILNEKGGLTNSTSLGFWKKRTAAGKTVIILNFAILVTLILQGKNSQIKNDTNDKKQDSIKYTDEATLAIAKKIDQFTPVLEKLHHLNIALDSNTNNLVRETKKITTDNLEITTKTKALTKNVEGLTTKVNNLLNRVHKEITGSKSVPIVQGHLIYNLFVNNLPEHPEYTHPLTDNKWIINFTLQNYGEYPLREIGIFRRFLYDYHGKLEQGELPNINLRPGETKSLLPAVVVDISRGLSYYYVQIKWEVEYSYHLTIQAQVTNHPQLNSSINYNYEVKSEYYEYKKAFYKSADSLKKAIQKDLKD